ncbi:Zinc metalloproteinase dpy-31 [Lamellibrachia satsuma]|nr:Zinc metalloproteinase dpy-31 [Lamellibrachia satsuma]
MWLERTLIVSALVSLIEGRGVVIPAIHEIWQPANGNRTEWFQCGGISCEQQDQTRRVLKDIVQIEKKSGKAATQLGAVDDGCFRYTKEQAEAVLANVKEESKARHKRKLENFVNLPHRKWRNPIFYKFDGSHDSDQKEIVRGAVRHWEKMTCVRFFEVNIGAPLEINHILLSRERPGCFSYVGRTNSIPQYINLADNCFSQFGVPVHEIGHALGFWHEHQRSDRDAHIEVHEENIGYALGQFWRRNTMNGDVPYDLGSVMHYSCRAGSWNKKRTIVAKDPHYNLNMGQRTGLSYLDAKLINLEYCPKSCFMPLPRLCQRGGYQDPNKCAQCRCPDGFSGTYCEDVAPAKNAVCGGRVFATPSTRYITSPGYERGYYDDYTECSWLIKAPANHRVVLTFEGFFGIYCVDVETCFHWLEVKSNNNVEKTGARFCCRDPPTDVIKSDTREMVLVFKSNFTTTWQSDRRGFKVKVVAEPDPNAVTVAETTVMPSTTTSKPTTTEPAASDEQGTSWSAWSACRNSDCACGGCSEQTRHRVCDNERCTGALDTTESRPCDRLCTKDDLRFVFVGKLYEYQCPVCCTQRGFHQSGSKCIKG